LIGFGSLCGLLDALLVGLLDALLLGLLDALLFGRLDCLLPGRFSTFCGIVAAVVGADAAPLMALHHRSS
jgi:hypothetical protein